MKGKLSFYYNAPTIDRVKSRLNAPAKELTQQFKDAVQEVTLEVLKEQHLTVKSKLIQKVGKLGLEYKDEKAKELVNSLLSDFFSVYYCNKPFTAECSCDKPCDTPKSDEEL